MAELRSESRRLGRHCYFEGRECGPYVRVVADANRSELMGFVAG